IILRPYKMFDFKGKVVVVTGGTRGIGKAIATELLAYGAKVLITGAKQQNIEEIHRVFGNQSIEWFQCDFSEPESRKRFINHLYTIGKIDVLINNAGINIINNVSDVLDTDY